MKKIVSIIIGNACIAAGIASFVIPNGIITGGVTGAGLIIHHYTALSVSLIVGGINSVLFLIGLIFLGKTFAMKTLISSVIFPFMLEGFQTIPYLAHLCDDKLLCAILAGVFVGIGVALILRSDASSGGFDTLALIIHNKTGWRLSILVNIFDALILSIQFLYATPTHIIYGFVMIVVSTLTLDRALRKAKRAVQLTIISHQAEAIRDYVLYQGDAGATLLYGETGYTHAPCKTVFTVLPLDKLTTIKTGILAIDPLAFVTIASIDEVGGKGFSVAH